MVRPYGMVWNAVGGRGDALCSFVAAAALAGKSWWRVPQRWRFTVQSHVRRMGKGMYGSRLIRPKLGTESILDPAR